MLKTVVLFALCCVAEIPCSALAQSVTDSLNHPPSPTYTNTVNNFYAAIDGEARLYNGKEYEFYDRSVRGNAYLLDNSDWNNGSVFYDGYLYKNVSMRYDLNKDLLVIQLYKSFLKISLVTDKVKSFDLLNHHFIYINDTSKKNAVKTGFYDQLYAGKIQVLARREKSLQSTSSSGAIDSFFTSSTDYYIEKNGEYYIVNSEGAFLNVLKDKKKDLQQFIKQNNIKYKKAREQAMTAIAAYYDHLTN